MRLAKSFLGSFMKGMGWSRRRKCEEAEDNDRRAAAAMDETPEPAQHLTHDTIGATENTRNNREFTQHTREYFKHRRHRTVKRHTEHNTGGAENRQPPQKSNQTQRMGVEGLALTPHRPRGPANQH